MLDEGRMVGLRMRGMRWAGRAWGMIRGRAWWMRRCGCMGWGILSVASAAVFPDGSAQLPTLTMMALALRLADRLAGR
jgi:uncharacterized membrane protein YcfT